VVGLGLYYAAVLIGSGASLPFMPVCFRAQGLSGTQMTIIFALPMFVRTSVSQSEVGCLEIALIVPPIEMPQRFRHDIAYFMTPAGSGGAPPQLPAPVPRRPPHRAHRPVPSRLRRRATG